MKQLVKRAVGRTPFAPLARTIYQRVVPGAGPDPDNRVAFKIMAEVLDPGSNCIDVGCHEGVLLEQMVRRAPRGAHLAFEPIPEYATALQQRFPDVEVKQVALSDTPGEAEFNFVASNPGYSGLRQRDYPRPNEEIRKIRVQTARLDDVRPAGRAVKLMKVDVEGGELHVFRGARRLLHEQKPIVIFEHGRGAAEHYGASPEMIWDLLVEECGMRISLLRSFLRGKRPLTREGLVAQFGGKNYNFVAHP
jgi:FkbM family methyltransferase